MLSLGAARAQETVPHSAEGVSAASLPIVEEFTADTLRAHEWKIGTDLDYGVTNHFMLGTDLVSFAIGAPTLAVKGRTWEAGPHQVSLGLRIAYLSKKTLLWGSANRHFDELEARVFRPSVSWTHKISPRLRLHTLWAKGFGSVNAELSEFGRRKLWETKHPGADYESRDQQTQAPTDDEDGISSDGGEDDDGEDDTIEDVDSEENLEKTSTEQSSLHHQSTQVQSITGLAKDRFQLTGEFIRRNGNRVLVTTRIEQTEIERLRSNSIRFSVAHHWIWSSFQMRLGIGVQYFSIAGTDLDEEEIDTTAVQPASDISFYWRF